MRFFDKDQKAQHAAEIGGYHSELLDEFGNPYTGPLQCHHMDFVKNGGETVPENLMFVDIYSHAALHLMADDPQSYHLIKHFMTEEQRDELARRGF